MFWLLFFGVAVVVVAALVLSQRQPADRDLMRLDPTVQESGYVQRKPLSEAEQLLHARLVEALPECVVLAKVSFRSFIQPTEGKGGSGRLRSIYFRVAQQTIDFLVCLRDFTVVAAVELDDGSSDRQDKLREELLKAAGIVPLRIRAGEMPSVEALRQMFT